MLCLASLGPLGQLPEGSYLGSRGYPQHIITRTDWYFRPVSLSGEAFFEGTAYASLASGSRGELESKELQHMLASVHSVLQSVQVEQRGISNGLKQVRF